MKKRMDLHGGFSIKNSNYMEYRTSTIVFPLITSFIITCELTFGILKTRSEYGTRTLVLSTGVLLLWGLLYYIDLKRIKNGQSEEYVIRCPRFVIISMAIVLGLFMVNTVWGSGYLTLAPYEAIDNGTQHIDSLFHSSIAESFKNDSQFLILLNDEEPLRYHTFSHMLMGIVSFLMRMPSFITYNYLYPVLFLPLYLFAQFFSVSSAKRHFEGAYEVNFWDVAVILLFNVGFTYKQVMGDYGVWKTSYIISESFLIANTIAFLVYGIIFHVIGNNQETSFHKRLFMTIVIPIAIFFLSWTKISVGFVFVISVAYYLFRTKFGNISFWLLNILYCATFLISAFQFRNGSNNVSGRATSVFRIGAFNDYCKGSYGIIIHYMILMIIPMLFVCFEFSRNRFGKEDFLKRKTVLIEDVVVTCVAAFTPGLLMDIPGGSAVYFSYFAEIPALILLCGHNYMKAENCEKNCLRPVMILLFFYCIWTALSNQSFSAIENISGNHKSGLSHMLSEIKDEVGNNPGEYTIFLEKDSLPSKVFSDGKSAAYVFPAMTGVGVINATYIANGIVYTYKGDEVSQYGCSRTNNTHALSYEEAIIKARNMGKKKIIHIYSDRYLISDCTFNR